MATVLTFRHPVNVRVRFEKEKNESLRKFQLKKCMMNLNDELDEFLLKLSNHVHVADSAKNSSDN